MATLQIVHTSGLDEAELAAIRRLLGCVFEDLTEDDWEHALGGVHAVVWDDGEPVAHGSVVMRRLIHGGRALRTGYVEAVAVRGDLRREGLGRRVMRALEGTIRGAYELGALAATDEAVAFYRSLGWRRWRGRSFALTPAGTVRTEEDDDAIFILPAGADIDLAGDLTCDWRDGDPW